jgi:preprotein translocase subunit SecA
MATNTDLDVGILEKLGDSLNAASEWVSKMLTRVFGASNERFVRKIGYIRNRDGTHSAIPGSTLAQVNELEDKMKALSDEELRGLTPKLRERLAKGATLEDLLPEAFAACREAARRTKNMRHYDVQIVGGVVLHRGNIAEMVTGEGKTLVATLPAYLNALEQKGVHVVTVNDYLARRDCEWMTPIYRALGVSAGFIQSDMDPTDRRAAYDCDITYGTNSEFGFDYLRDNMKPARWGDPNFIPYQQQCQKALNYAIIDEVDNILIDEARTPLIISGPAFTDVRRYDKANQIAVALTDLQKKGEGPYFEVKEKEHSVHLTDEGVRKAEEIAGVESFYTAGNMEWPHLIDNSLKAHHLYKKDKQYAVMRHPETGELSIIIIDEFTGRLMIGRQWSDGLHQAVEAKHGREGVKIKEETQTLATVTLQNFFKLYKKLAGMTGTAMTEANEFWKIYHLEVIAIPTNRPLIRVNHADVIFRTEKEKWKAVVDEVYDVNQQGRPILIGTCDVDNSIKLSEMLKRRGLKHELLNALPEHAAREAEIVAQAGRIGSITIATNMAGRGTDIILGGNPETMAWARLKSQYPTRLEVPEDIWKKTVEEIEAKEKMKEQGRQVAEMGGLHIVGTERHEARRIDNQLRGRAGRQGDPGSSRFFLSLQDDLMRKFAGEWVSGLLGRLGMEEGQAIESGMVSRQIEGAQKKVEERNFDIRKHLLEYDEVMDHQRKRVYGYRQEILEGANCKTRILQMLDSVIDLQVDEFLDRDYGAACFAEFASKRLGIEFDASNFAGCNFEEAVKSAHAKAAKQVQTQVQELIEENLGSEDEREWNWQALAHTVNSRWGLSVNDRELKKIGADNLSTFLIEKAEKALDAVDLSEGKSLLAMDWGARSVADWARLKFQIAITPELLRGKDPAAVKTLLNDAVSKLYCQKEIEFPVQVGMIQFMAERSGPGGQRYNRDGLHRWARERFPAYVAPPRAGGLSAGESVGALGVELPQNSPQPDPEAYTGKLTEEDFHTLSRANLFAKLLEISKKVFPEVGHDEIDEQVAECFSGTRLSDADDAKELAEWARQKLNLQMPESALTGVSSEQARNVLWNAFDERYRPEMHTMERSLVLSQLDQSWKNHLYTMDHLRSVVGLRSYAQEDPKTVYKREGMKEFETMWEGIHDRVTDAVFRMEEAEGFQESLWTIGATIHEKAPELPADDIRGQQDAAIAGSQKSEKKPEPIRNRGERVGRNEPCPCGSGKKYKNCHMKMESGARK